LTLKSESRFDLRRLGWDDGWADTLAPYGSAGLTPARVASQSRAGYAVLGTDGESPADLAGRLRHEAAGGDGLPAVGDWVAVDAAGDRAVIRAVLPRRTAVTRKAAGREALAQVLAANVDVVVVLSSLESDPNLRRLERYLSAAWESGARPLVALTKADLRADAEAVAAEAAASVFVSVHAVSALTGQGLAEIEAELAGDRTLVFVGPSGVGKSTLVNRVLGADRQQTQDVRRDGKGRHTTTSRELFLVPRGGVLIDTPGLRELGLWSGDGAGADETFAEIVELATSCRFADCAHAVEPGCAIQTAIAEGRLSRERLESFQKLEREIAWMERRRDGRAIAEARRARRRFARSMRRSSEGPWKI
jgi:ribosome biogenesis GTPase / thiamine phosphate phosphatase